ncbi:hypothetical protein GCM10027404_32480 [Arthrobacter tumbae]
MPNLLINGFRYCIDYSLPDAPFDPRAERNEGRRIAIGCNPSRWHPTLRIFPISRVSMNKVGTNSNRIYIGT